MHRFATLVTTVALTMSGLVVSPAHADTAGIDWTVRSSPEGDWTSVTYGNGIFVAVSAGYSLNSNVMTSTDGITWTPISSAAPSGRWWSIAFGNGTFVAVAYQGDNRIMTSTNGTTWTAQSAPEINEWNSVVYGKGMFVAISGSGTNRVMTSPDGITWTRRSAAAPHEWWSVTYGNGLFVAVPRATAGSVAQIMTSSNGITWMIQTVPAANRWYSVVYGNGVFVAVANGGEVMTSPDGITWMAREAAAGQWTSVTYGNGMYVAVSYDGKVMTSPDGGITWTLQTTANALWSSVTYRNGMFVAVAISGAYGVMTSGTIAAPAAADYTLDCNAEPGLPFVDLDPNDLAYYDGNIDVVRNSPQAVTVTVSVVNCADWETHNGSGRVSDSDFTLVIPANSFGFVRAFNVETKAFAVTVRNGFVPNPDSTLLSTVDIALVNQTLDLNNSAGWVASNLLGSKQGCALQRIANPNTRYYQTQSFNIVKSGSYTFRVIDTSAGNISDTFLALYTTFDTSDLDFGLVACADDYGVDGGAENSFISSGTPFKASYSAFNKDLAPGIYTALLTTYATTDALVVNQSAKVEMWGPDCGLQGGACTPVPLSASAGNSAPAIETPAQVVDTGLAASTIGFKKKYSAKTLAKQVGITMISPKATVSISVAKSSKKVCIKSGVKLRTLKAGNCNVTFTVQEPKPKKGKKPKATKTTTTLVVQ